MPCAESLRTRASVILSSFALMPFWLKSSPVRFPDQVAAAGQVQASREPGPMAPEAVGVGHVPDLLTWGGGCGLMATVQVLSRHGILKDVVRCVQVRAHLERIL